MSYEHEEYFIIVLTYRLHYRDKLILYKFEHIQKHPFTSLEPLLTEKWDLIVSVAAESIKIQQNYVLL